MTRWRRATDALWRWNGPRVVVLGAGAEEVVMLDGAGAWLWELLEAGPDQATLTTELGELFEAPVQQIETDVTALLVDLEARGIVVQDPAKL